MLRYFLLCFPALAAASPEASAPELLAALKAVRSACPLPGDFDRCKLEQGEVHVCLLDAIKDDVWSRMLFLAPYVSVLLTCLPSSFPTTQAHLSIHTLHTTPKIELEQQEGATTIDMATTNKLVTKIVETFPRASKWCVKYFAHFSLTSTCIRAHAYAPTQYSYLPAANRKRVP
jgi:hypothetical protein